MELNLPKAPPMVDFSIYYSPLYEVHGLKTQMTCHSWFCGREKICSSGFQMSQALQKRGKVKVDRRKSKGGCKQLQQKV